MIRTIQSALLLFIVGTACPVVAQTSEEVPVGEKLRDAKLRGLNGPERNLSEFFGRPLIINVWASWCGPCRAEMKSLERLAWLDESHDLTVIGISTDDYEDRAVDALTRSNATISHFIDANLLMEQMLGASRLPLTVLVSADGRVLQRIYGAREWDSPAALALIDSVLRSRSDDAPAP
jgi:thiol-disulfide isomerase/thioredoxin